MIKFPYGKSDFNKIITDGYYYVDRTQYLPIIEEIGDTLVFLRPRRFGKTLLLSMLDHYYDINKAEDFDRLFGHLAIGQNPTPKHNQYMILRWDFSLLQTDSDMPHTSITKMVFDVVNHSIEEFVATYESRLSRTVRIDWNSALSSLQSLFNVVRASSMPLYLLVDEYDNVANTILMGTAPDSHTRYESLVQGEGVFKAIFKTVKYGLAWQGIDRAFITGVSPMALTDMGSGFNVSEDITFYEEFAEVCGFRESEIGTMLDQVVQTGRIPAELAATARETMQTFYNGYRFVPEQTVLLYNPTLSLYFLKHLQRMRRFPVSLLDRNLEMDQSKLRYLSHIPQGDDTILDIIAEDRPFKIQDFSARFGITDLLDAPTSLDFLGSLLYYFGILTIAERDARNQYHLIVPNQVTRQLYYDYIRTHLLPSSEHLHIINRVKAHFYDTGDLTPICEFVNSTYLRSFDNRDYLWANEFAIKIAFVTILSNPDYYLTETESRIEQHYCDMLMLVRADLRGSGLQDCFFEFKYIALHDLHLSGEDVRALDVRALTDDEARALPLVQSQLAKAEKSIATYRPKLLDRYREITNLHSYAVVGLGFHKVVWTRTMGNGKREA